MSQVEAAASLFGSSDSDADFFSVSEGENSVENSATGTPSNGDDFYSSSSKAASGFFDPVEVGSGEQPLFDATGETAQAGGSHVSSFPDDTAHGRQYFQESHAQYASYTTEAYAADGQAAGHVYDQGTWQSEGLNQQAGSDAYYPTYDNTNTSNSYRYPASTDTYSSYDPMYGDAGSQHGSAAHSGFPTQSTSSTFVPYASYTGSQSPSNTYTASPSTKASDLSVYDPYKPATTANTQPQTRSASYSAMTPSRSSFSQVPVNSTTPSVSNVFEAATQSVQLGAYDPYKPSTGQAPSVPPPKLPAQGMSYPLSAPAMEPVKSTPPPRPAVSNAYDPPMPLTQRKKSRSAFAPAQSPMHPQHSPFAAPTNIYAVQQPPQNVANAGPPLPPPPPASSMPPPSYAYSPSTPPSEQYPRTASPLKGPPARATPPPPPTKHYGPGSPHKGYAPLAQPSYSTGRMSPMQGPGVPSEHAHQGTLGYAPVSQQNPSMVWNGNANSSGSANGDISHGNNEYSPDLSSAYSHNKTPPLSSQVHHPSSPPRRGSAFEATRGATPPVGLPRTLSPLQHLAYQQDDGFNHEANYSGYGSHGDEVQATYGEPYGHVPRPSFDERAKSPTGDSVRSGGSGNARRDSMSMAGANSGQNVVDLTESDTSSVYNASSSPSSRALPPLVPGSGIISEETGLSFGSYNVNKPVSRSSSPQTFVRPAADPYAPASYSPPSAEQTNVAPSRMRSMSSTSTFSQTSIYDPYAPTRSNTIHEEQTITSMYSPPNLYLPPSQAAPIRSSVEKPYSPPPITGPYAPSPSLSGTNDPLGRTRVRVPLIQFGFGGKILTCFHSSPLLETGYDYNIAPNKSTDVTIRLLHKLLPDSSADASTVGFPGPLFGDSSSPATTLAITSTANAAKTKKTKVLTYLDERAKELEQGSGYHAVGSPERRRTEGKLVLVRLLHAMIENDGHISGSPIAVSVARKALLPHLSSSTEGTDAGSVHVPMNISAPDRGSTAYPSFGTTLNSDQTFAEYIVRTSALDKIQSFLLRGELRQAYHFALDEKMWAHAMVIAHGLDKDSFREVAEEFIKTELGVKGVRVPGSALPVKTEGSVVNGRECLRLAYGLYAGQASTAVQQLLPSRLSNGQTMTTLTVQPPTPLNHMTPMSPSFPSIAVATGVPSETLAKWQEYVAILLSGQAGTDSSTSLTTLGDYLVSNDWVEAGHCCYLLSPQTSPFGGVGTPAARIVLLGSQSPLKNTAFYRDSDSFTFSEIVEYALSLRAPVKGQEAFGGFPHLQAYRLVRAQQLAELGHMAAAKRYCDAILTCTSRPSPYLTSCLLDQLSDFSNRLHGNIELDKSSSWMGSKISKPSLDSIGGWLGGTLSKFVAGEVEPSSPLSREGSISESATYTGAFQHYSSISSTNPSRGPSPAPSVSNGPIPPPAQWKSSSSTAQKSLYNAQNPISRASSAIDHLRPGSRKNTPPPRVASANAMTTTFAQSRTFTHTSSMQDIDTQAYNGEALSDTSGNQDGGGWWSAAYGDSGGPTPTATSFDRHGEHVSATTNGFISPADSYQSSTSSATTPVSLHTEEEDEFDDELGLGNAAHKSKKAVAVEQNGTSNEREAKTEPSKREEEPPKKPELRTATSGSWLGRFWSRGSTPAAIATTPGPVKANLGDQSSFYYDKDLKRWVNKKSGSEASKAEAPPPPPSRAQTTSPSRAAPASASSPSYITPPPPRPMSVAAPGMAPPLKSLPRIRSNLVPDASTDSAPPTPAVMSGITGAPPTGRSKSAAAPSKRGARNRYVDVFQNGNA